MAVDDGWHCKTIRFVAVYHQPDFLLGGQELLTAEFAKKGRGEREEELIASF
jgi:hypothetical protein